MKSQKGITLVALVVTIVVLLILAGITIALVMNPDTSIFSNSRKAESNTEVNSVRELMSTAFMSAQTNYLARDTEVYSGVTDFLGSDAATKFAADLKKEAGYLGVEISGNLTITIATNGTAPNLTFKGIQMAEATVTYGGKKFKVTIDTTAAAPAERITVTQSAS